MLAEAASAIFLEQSELFDHLVGAQRLATPNAVCEGFDMLRQFKPHQCTVRRWCLIKETGRYLQCIIAKY
jgi:hypothetical protein